MLETDRSPRRTALWQGLAAADFFFREDTLEREDAIRFRRDLKPLPRRMNANFKSLFLLV